MLVLAEIPSAEGEYCFRLIPKWKPALLVSIKIHKARQILKQCLSRSVVAKAVKKLPVIHGKLHVLCVYCVHTYRMHTVPGNTCGSSINNSILLFSPFPLGDDNDDDLTPKKKKINFRSVR